MQTDNSRRRFMQTGGALAGSLALPRVSSAAGTTFDRPKAAALDYRKGALNTPAAIALHLKYSHVVLNMLPSHAKAPAGTSPGGAGYLHVQQLRNASSTIAIGQYTILSQMYDPGAEYQTIIDTLTTNGWWVMTGTTSDGVDPLHPVAPQHRTKPLAGTNYDAWDVNQNKIPAVQAMADWWYQTVLRPLASVGLNMAFNDNVWANPGTSDARASDGSNALLKTGEGKGWVGAYDGNTNEQTSSWAADRNLSVNARFRLGYISYVNRLKSLQANDSTARSKALSLIANADYDIASGSQYRFTSCLERINTAESNTLYKVYDYAFIEALTGRNYSVDTYARDFKNATLKLYKSAANGALKNVFVCSYLDSNLDTKERTLQKARYGLGLAMLGDGIAMITDTPTSTPENPDPESGAHRPYWFDELEVQIGKPVDPAFTENYASWSKGVWIRKYENGCVVLNPSSNYGGWMGNAGTGAAPLTLERRDGIVTLTWVGGPDMSKRTNDFIRIQDCYLSTLPKASPSNTGNGSCSRPQVKRPKLVTEVWTLTALSSTTFEVRGSASGLQASATVGRNYDNGLVKFSISAGSVAFVKGDVFTFTTDCAFNGSFTLSAPPVSTTLNGAPCVILKWNQQGQNVVFTRPEGFVAMQTIVDLAPLGQAYRRILGDDDGHNSYFTGTSQNDGGLATSVRLWSNDAILLLKV
ncbi:hypothetical protein [Ideonella sp. BN130291]|uniref:hypothetical protein n=1 Tax=Ideonella sp. BN130291 TaxID=3112940 RepID=UPI002E269CF3|nr:hypothetical protein [Ideonella sp. BN130291]